MLIGEMSFCFFCLEAIGLPLMSVKMFTQLILNDVTTACDFLKLFQCIAPRLTNFLLEEIKLINRKSDVDLEFLSLRHLQTALICNHKVIGLLAVKGQ